MMIIVCNRCGNYEPEDSQFCGKCRAFLEFDGTLVEGQWVDGRLAKATSPAPGGAATAQQAGGAAATAQQPGGAPASTQQPGAAAASTQQPSGGVAVEPRGGVAMDPPGGVTVGPRDGVGTAAQRPDARTAAQQPDRDTAAQQPGEARQVYQARVEPLRAPVDGGFPCPKCGRGNDPDRTYCRFDGEPLHPVAAPPEVRPPWWKRLLRRLFGRRRDGARSGRRQASERRFRFPTKWVVVALVAVLAVVYHAQVRTFTKWAEIEVRDRFAKHQPITPSKLTASSSRPGDGPERLTDRASNQFWAPQGEPTGSWVEFELPKAVRLLDIVVTGGQDGESVEFQKQGRPNEIDAVLTSQDGKTTTSRLVMEDRQGAQTFKVKGDRVVKIRLSFVSAHGMEPGRFMAVAEVEFFYRS